MAYDPIFTLTANGTTIHWIARPPEIDYEYFPRSAKHSIPGTIHSIRQMLGSDSTQYAFKFLLHDIKLVYTSGVIVATDPQEVFFVLLEWMQSGRTCDWIADEVTQGLGVVSLEVKIVGLRKKEVKGTVHKYEVELVLEAYWS